MKKNNIIDENMMEDYQKTMLDMVFSTLEFLYYGDISLVVLAKKMGIELKQLVVSLESLEPLFITYFVMIASFCVLEKEKDVKQLMYQIEHCNVDMEEVADKLNMTESELKKRIKQKDVYVKTVRAVVDWLVNKVKKDGFHDFMFDILANEEE